MLGEGSLEGTPALLAAGDTATNGNEGGDRGERRGAAGERARAVAAKGRGHEKVEDEEGERVEARGRARSDGLKVGARDGLDERLRLWPGRLLPP